MRAAVAKLDFGQLSERAPAPVVPLRNEASFAANLLPAAASPKAEAPDRPGNTRKIRGLDWSGRLDLNQRPLAPQASALPGCATPRHCGLAGWGGCGGASEGGGSITRPARSQRELPDPKSYAPFEEFSAFFSTCDGRKVSTRRALISISCPVCGFRPTRERFSRTTKLPKPESLIFSPFSRVSLMVSNTISTISALSFLENPTSLHTLSITSALVMDRP